MSTKARIVLTVALGIVMGVSTWLSGDWTGDVFFASVVLLPLIVGRWWVVAALAGPFIASVALDLTGHVYEGGSDGAESYLFPWGIIGLFFWELVMLILVGIRKAFDFLRNRWAIANS
jgi:hypothetical protein